MRHIDLKRVVMIITFITIKIYNMKKLLIFGITIFLIGSSCNKKNDQPDINSSGTVGSTNMLINNNLSTLNKRIALADNTPVYIFGDNATAKNSKGTATSSVTIQLIARLLPPEYNGEVLQASHVRIVDHYAYVTYNTQGPRYLGGVDIVDISVPDNPALISSVLFINPETNKGKDVSSVDVKFSSTGESNTLLWITGADETRDSAFAEKYELNSSNQFVAGQSVNYFLKGFTGTDIRFYNDKVYVTSGTGGGLTVLDDQMKEVNFLNLENARSVDVNKDIEIALGGNPGHIYNPGVWDQEIGGATDPGAKSILRLHEKYALAALGEDGLKCFDVSSGAPSAPASALPGPAVPEGKAAWDYVTNGVSVSDNGWVYIANGAGGLDIAKLDPDGQLTWMGNVDLGASVNFVEANSNYVFVARGVLGLKILKVTEN
jgi:hypothetical protein